MPKILNTAYYDLLAAPITFDFVHFLAAARIYFAATTGSAEFHLIILVDKWRNLTPREKSYGMKERYWRLFNLLIPVVSMSHCVTSFEVSQDRPEQIAVSQRVYPPNYSPASPNIPYMPSSIVYLFEKTRIIPQFLNVPECAKDYAQQMLNDIKRPCIVSIRGSAFERQRNSDVSYLKHSIEAVLSAGLTPIVLPDQENHNICSEELHKLGAKILDSPSFSLPLRLALCELAEVSIFTPCGLSSLCSMLASKPTLLIYGLIQNHHLASEQYFISQGYDINSTQALPWTPQCQHWVWNSRLITINKALQNLLSAISG